MSALDQAKVDAVARNFVSRLRRDLGADEFEEMCRRNRDETNPSVCHSHDFCDANVVMEQAFVDVYRREPFGPCDAEEERATDAQVEADVDVFNAAWEKAKPSITQGSPRTFIAQYSTVFAHECALDDPKSEIGTLDDHAAPRFCAVGRDLGEVVARVKAMAEAEADDDHEDLDGGEVVRETWVELEGGEYARRLRLDLVVRPPIDDEGNLGPGETTEYAVVCVAMIID